MGRQIVEKSSMRIGWGQKVWKGWKPYIDAEVEYFLSDDKSTRYRVIFVNFK